MSREESRIVRTVVQVVPREDFTVFVYFDDGRIKLFDMSPHMGKGVFQPISNPKDFVAKCTVLNGTLAWDLSGRYDPTECLDIDPESIYASGTDVRDPLSEPAA